MANQVTMWVADDGEVLIPLSLTADNTSPLVSDSGRYFIPFIKAEAGTPVTGNPIGLLLALTYS